MNTKRTILICVWVAGTICAPPHAIADFTFGEPVNLESVIPVFDPAYDSVDCFSSDGMELFIESTRDGGHGGVDLWVLTRVSIDAPWSIPENLGPLVNGPSHEALASVSSDGLALYFDSNRPGGQGSWDLYMTTRPTKSDPWDQAVNLGPQVNSSSGDGDPWISPDGRELYFVSYRPGGYGQGDVWVARRATQSDPWQVPVNLGPIVNSPYDEHFLSLSPDGLLLLLGDADALTDTPRPDGHGQSDMWMARRTAVSAPWQPVGNLGPNVNGPAMDLAPRIAPDGRTLYFCSNRTGNRGRYQAPIIPICDFNSDGVVDVADVRIMIEHWGENHPLCDIGPFPWGDGVVDVQDLIVLAEHL